MNLDEKPIRTRGDSGQGHRLHQIPSARAMTGIDEYWQMGKLLEQRDGAQIHGISRLRLVRPNTPLAKNDLSVTARRDVLCRKQELLDRRTHAALEHDRLVELPHLREEFEVLHVPRPDLENVGVAVNEIEIARVEHLRDDR